MCIRDAIREVIAGSNLSTEQSRAVFGQIMAGEATDAQIAAFITALRMKGETVEEITGAAQVMKEKATHVIPACRDYLADTCGTGGDGSNTFNISTAAALVAAGAGVTVAKHGNRGVSSRSGSADVLEALGVRVAIAPDRMKACLDEIGICFLYAPALHAAMKYAIGPRKEIGIRTIFNILGPLTNPSLAPAQVLGVFSADLTETMAGVLRNLQSRRAFVVHGDDGLDEISTCAPTRVTELSDGAITTYTVEPEQYGIRRAGNSALAGGTPQENASIVLGILDREQGPRRDIVLLNAAFAIAASGRADTPGDGLALATASIDSGAARRKLDGLVRLTSG